MWRKWEIKVHIIFVCPSSLIWQSFYFTKQNRQHRYTLNTRLTRTQRTLSNNTSLQLLRQKAPHTEVSWTSRFPRQHSSGRSPAQQLRTQSLLPKCTTWWSTVRVRKLFTRFLSLFVYSTGCMWLCVTDLRTAPVRKLTFSVTRLRICSRSCRMVRGMMNRNGGHRRSPLRKTLSRKDRFTF